MAINFLVSLLKKNWNNVKPGTQEREVLLVLDAGLGVVIIPRRI